MRGASWRKPTADERRLWDQPFPPLPSPPKCEHGCCLEAVCAWAQDCEQSCRVAS